MTVAGAGDCYPRSTTKGWLCLDLALLSLDWVMIRTGIWFSFFLSISAQNCTVSSRYRLWESMTVGTIPILERGVGFDRTVRNILNK